jgi:hypothetical protein
VETPLRNQLLQVRNAKNSIPSDSSRAEDSFLTSQHIATAMQMPTECPYSDGKFLQDKKEQVDQVLQEFHEDCSSGSCDLCLDANIGMYFAFVS